AKKNLFIAFDAFGTLFTPKLPIGQQYGAIARKHGICKEVSDDDIMRAFGKSFKNRSKEAPNYGKAVGWDPTVWWGHVITGTFKPFLSEGQTLPKRLIPDLLTHFASREGYDLYPDVVPIFKMFREMKQQQQQQQQQQQRQQQNAWKFDRTVIGVVTNSDDRVAGILRSFDLRVGHGIYGEPMPPPPARAHPAKPEDNDVDFVLTSYDCGYEKPHRGIFDAAREMLLQRFSVVDESGTRSPEDSWQMLYVGDEFAKDVVGSEAAGWDALLIDRE
ncbi:uncharacterized protein K452DRAFT_200136, partial [Aplosporella prunicola CBS 121167]